MSKKYDDLTQAEIDAIENDDLKSDEEKEAEAAKKAEEEAAAKKAKEEEEAAKKAEKDAAKAKGEDDKKKADEEAKAKAEDEAKKAEEEKARKAEEDAKKAEAEEAARKKAEEDEAVKKAAREKEEEGADDEDEPITPIMKTLSEKDVKDLNEQLKALKAKRDEGEIDTDAYIEQREEIVRKLTKNDYAIEANNTAREANWQTAQRNFYRSNPVFKNPAIETAFVAKVNEFIKTPEAEKMSDAALLRHCKGLVKDDLAAVGIILPESKSEPGKTDDKDNEKAAKLAAAKKKNAGKDTTNLNDVSTAQSNDEEESWMEELDKMDAPEREEALAKMSKAKRDQYLSAG